MNLPFVSRTLDRLKRANAYLKRTSLAQALHNLGRDERGLGAVEFAILAPVLLMLYIGVFELTLGFSTAKRVTRSAGTIADIVTQKPTTSKPELADMLNVAKSYIAPYSTEGLKLKVTGISMDDTMIPKVAWSWAEDGNRPYVANSVTSVPATLLKANSFLVRVEVSIDHELLMFMPSIVMKSTTIPIERANFFPPRTGDAVNCGDC